MDNKTTTEPIYKQIALDLAGRIYNGDMMVGEKISGRSTLASKYNVSPETVRKAIKLLEDMDVVCSNRGSGVNILSKEKAYDFIDRFHSMESVSSIKHDIYKMFEERNKIEKNIGEMIEQMVDYSNRLRYTNPLTPIEVDIPDASEILGKSISEAKFWQNTGATIIGVRRGKELFISPGPYFIFEKNDIILAVGNESIVNSMNKYFNKN